jgi:HK97 family phage prohead protease
MNNRAWSVLEIKSIDDDHRVLTGIATTPEMDRVGDIVDPMGASYAKEIPLLWQHQHDNPVGFAELGRATKSGIPFKATIASIDQDGDLKRLLDKAWQSVKTKLVRGVSIGFRAKKYDIMSEGGIRFTDTEIYELSLVTIPANASASIQTIKNFDIGFRRVNGGIPLIQVPKAERPKDYVRLVLP